MPAASSPHLRRTALYDRHRAAGAKLVEFAGWEMPVQYTGVRDEHIAVREDCGIFDVSHMGQIETSGPGALALLQRLLSNDVAAIPVGGAQYSVLCREDGGVLDDLFTYRLDDDRYLTVTNAANHERDLDWFRAVARELQADGAPGLQADGAPELHVELADRIDDYAMLAVQGPRARAIVQGLADDRSRGTLASDRSGGTLASSAHPPFGEHPRVGQLPARMSAAMQRLAGAEAEVLVCGTGYTGEDGVELLLAPSDAPALWDELVRQGATPAGLAARDTLRLEACFHLYGNDLSTARGPIEAGLGWCCKEDTGFIGAEAVRAVRAAGPTERLAAFALDGPGIARAGNTIVGGGVVTSGTLSPCLGIGIGLAYVPAERAAVDTCLEIDVRGRLRAARVRRKPFVTKHG